MYFTTRGHDTLFVFAVCNVGVDVIAAMNGCSTEKSIENEMCHSLDGVGGTFILIITPLT